VQPDRLAELQRQRELVRAHLAWLDREIAAASSGGERAPGNAAPAPAPAPAVDSAIVASGVPAPYAPPQPNPLGAAADAKRGCLILFAGIFALGLLALVAIYFLRYEGRPMF
jgi:hypothetical protein